MLGKFLGSKSLYKLSRFLFRRPYYAWANFLSVPESEYKWHGLNFSGSVNMHEEGHSNYSTTSSRTLNRIGNYLYDKVTNSDAIIDVGCGKGRMLYFFSQFPFKYVDGLEYSRELVAAAEENIAIMRNLRSEGGGYKSLSR